METTGVGGDAGRAAALAAHIRGFLFPPSMPVRFHVGGSFVPVRSGVEPR